MQHHVEVHHDDTEVASAAAGHVTAAAHRAVSQHGSFSFAVSGGHTPWAMFAVLAQREMPWERTRIFQVDERMAPAGDPRQRLHAGVLGQPFVADQHHSRSTVGDLAAVVAAQPACHHGVRRVVVRRAVG